MYKLACTACPVSKLSTASYRSRERRTCRSARIATISTAIVPGDMHTTLRLSHAPHSSKVFPKPGRIDHELPPVPAPRAPGYTYRSSERARPTPMPSPLALPAPAPAAPSSQPVHQPVFSPSLSAPLPSRALPLPFMRPRSLALDLPLWNLEDAPAGFELEYGSGGSAKEMRFGVEAPEDVPLRGRTPSIWPKTSGTLSRDAEGVWRAGVSGVIGVVGAERPFMEDCLGGEGGRVVVCRFFVNRRDTDAVAVEVPAIGATLGVDSKDGLGSGGGAELVDPLR